ncbi:MAG: SulP family inorganic anion transporter [Candidatus Nanopelagicales bacterium]
MLGSFRGFRRSEARFDALAGLTVWAVLVPESLAYATIAGVPPVVGLYAAVPALLLYALLGSSRHMVVATMSATAALSASIVGAYAVSGTEDYLALTATLAIVTGVLAILAGLLRFGFLASFISEPVLKGFIVGLALTIIAGQLPELVGVEKVDGNFFQQLVGFVGELGSTNAATVVVGLASLGIVLGLRRWLPIVPGSLVAVLVGIAAVPLLDLVAKGVAIVGPIDAGLPTVGLPQGREVADYLMLAAAAAGVLLIAFAEGLAAAKAYADKAGYDIDPNQELLALGAANVGSGLTSGMVVNGSLSKTAVNGSAGARSQLSGVTVAILVVITLLFLTGLFENLPEATLAAVVIAAVIELVNIPSLLRLYRIWTGQLGGIYGWAARADFIAALAALLGVLLFDILPGLFIGIGVSLLLLIYRASRPQVATLVRSSPTVGNEGRWVDARTHPELARRDDIVVVRVESGLFFANADHVRQQIRDRITASTVAVVIDAETTPAIDVSATDMLITLAAELRRRDIGLLVAHGIGQIRDVLRHAGRDDDVLQAVYSTVDDAIESVDRASHDADPD